MSSRPRGFIYGWKPQAKTKALVAEIQLVLDEYSAQLPLTLRQVFYRLVAKGVIGKTERDYKRLCEVANKARRAREISFVDIRDDGFTYQELSGLDDVADFWSVVQNYADTFKLDRQADQSTRLMLWCEAAGMVPQLESVAHPYGVPVLSSGGFDSVTSKFKMATRLSEYDQVEVLHIGDHDPSGVHIFYSLEEDIDAFARAYGGDVRFVRLAVTPEQVMSMSLPTAPPKKTDNRSFSGATCQAEAIPPNRLSEIVRDAIEERIDLDIYRQVVERESSVRKVVLEMLEAVND